MINSSLLFKCDFQSDMSLNIDLAEVIAENSLPVPLILVLEEQQLELEQQLLVLEQQELEGEQLQELELEQQLLELGLEQQP